MFNSQKTNKEIEINLNRDVFYQDSINEVEEICEPEVLNAEDPLFILHIRLYRQT